MRISDLSSDVCSSDLDQNAASGRRDYAILLLLSGLGLRAQEVATLSLDDIDWRAGQFRIQGKGRQQAIMPLPPDVGAAIAAYLQSGRPVSDRRQLFLRAYPPHSGFPPTSGIRDIAARARSEENTSELQSLMRI